MNYENFSTGIIDNNNQIIYKYTITTIGIIKAKFNGNNYYIARIVNLKFHEKLNTKITGTLSINGPLSPTSQFYNIEITGYLYDINNNPLSGKTVRDISTGGLNISQAITNDSGYFKTRGTGYNQWQRIIFDGDDEYYSCYSYLYV